MPSLFIEATAPSAKPSDIELTATLTGIAGAKSVDKVVANTAAANLVIAGLAEADEETAGVFIPLNDNTDEGNAMADADHTPQKDNQPDAVYGDRVKTDGTDKELVDATLWLMGPAGVQGNYYLTYPDELEVWNKDTGQRVMSGTNYPGAYGTTPVKLLIEGTKASTDMRDISVTAGFTPDGGLSLATPDSINATVYDVDVEMQGLQEENLATPHELSPGSMLSLHQSTQASLKVVPADLNLGALSLVDPSGSLKFWRDEGKSVEVSNWVLGSAEIPTAAQLPAAVWVDMAVASTSTTQATLSLTEGSPNAAASDSAKVRLLSADLSLESPSADAAERLGEGAFIPLNDNFDESNQQPNGTPLRDYSPDWTHGDRALQNDSDLVNARLTLLGAPNAKGTWRIVNDDPTELRVWNAETMTEISSDAPQQIALSAVGILSSA